MRKALLQAQHALEKGEIPVGAVLVAQDVILAQTHNQTELLKDFTAHAEMLALSAATQALGSKYLNQATLYITLSPCVMCAGACFWSKIGTLVYAAADVKTPITELKKILHPKTSVIEGVLAEESQKLLREFFQKKR